MFNDKTICPFARSSAIIAQAIAGEEYQQADVSCQKQKCAFWKRSKLIYIPILGYCFRGKGVCGKIS